MELADWQKTELIFRWSYTGEACSFDTLRRCVGAGWEKLLSETCAKLFALGWTGGVDQIKEKYGTLRFYFQNDCKYPEIAWDVVEVALDKSGQICEVCGDVGWIHNEDFWVTTRCDKCYKEEREANRSRT